WKNGPARSPARSSLQCEPRASGRAARLCDATGVARHVDRQRAGFLGCGTGSDRFAEHLDGGLGLLDRVDDHRVRADFRGAVTDLRLELIVEAALLERGIVSEL